MRARHTTRPRTKKYGAKPLQRSTRKGAAKLLLPSTVRETATTPWLRRGIWTRPWKVYHREKSSRLWEASLHPSALSAGQSATGLQVASQCSTCPNLATVTSSMPNRVYRSPKISKNSLRNPCLSEKLRYFKHQKSSSPSRVQSSMKIIWLEKSRGTFRWSLSQGIFSSKLLRERYQKLPNYMNLWRFFRGKKPNSSFWEKARQKLRAWLSLFWLLICLKKHSSW